MKLLLILLVTLLILLFIPVKEEYKLYKILHKVKQFFKGLFAYIKLFKNDN